MLIIKTDQPNYMVVTVSQNSELTNPEYLFSFVHIFSKEKVNFIPVDVSTHKSRYDEFYFVEGSGVNEINFPYSGQYIYTISEQPSGSGNLDPALATNVVENGEAQIIVQSAITQDSQYDIFISNNEFDSNIIFAPDEPNPTPNITPSPTNTPNQPTPTPTPSITPTYTPTATITPSATPTFTPTPSSTPAIFNPSDLGALWWVDFTDPTNLNLNTGSTPNNISGAKDNISNNFIFSAQTGSGPSYSGTGYYSLSGVSICNGDGLSTALSVYSGQSFSAYTTFSNISLTAPNGGETFNSDNAQNYLGETQGYRWFEVDNYLNNQPNMRTYSFFTNGNSVNPEPRSADLDSGYWYFVATRVYQTGSTAVVEVHTNGNIDDDIYTNGADIYTATSPIFAISRGSSQNILTSEQFFFGRALTDAEMTQMWNYLAAKYPLQ